MEIHLGNFKDSTLAYRLGICEFWTHVEQELDIHNSAGMINSNSESVGKELQVGMLMNISYISFLKKCSGRISDHKHIVVREFITKYGLGDILWIFVKNEGI
jgi:hypothetical protein